MPQVPNLVVGSSSIAFGNDPFDVSNVPQVPNLAVSTGTNVGARPVFTDAQTIPILSRGVGGTYVRSDATSFDVPTVPDVRVTQNNFGGSVPNFDRFQIPNVPVLQAGTAGTTLADSFGKRFEIPEIPNLGDPTSMLKPLNEDVSYFLNVVMGVNSLPLSEAFESKQAKLPMVPTTEWDRLIPYLVPEVVAASAAVVNYTRRFRENVDMADVVTYGGYEAAAFMGRIMTIQGNCTASSNPTKETAIQAFTWVEKTRKYYETKIEKSMTNPKRKRDRWIYPYVEFLTIVVGIAGKPYRNAYGHNVPYDERAVSRWSEIKKYVSSDVLAAVEASIAYYRKFKPRSDPDDLVFDETLRYPFARLVGRFLVTYESNNVRNGVSHTVVALSQTEMESALRGLRVLAYTSKT